MVTGAHLKAFGLPLWLDMERPVFPSLEGNQVTDIAIVGGGICGLKLARCLDRYGLRAIVLEANRVGSGASSRNEGSINQGPDLSYADAINRYSRKRARELWELGLASHELLKEEMAEFGIECDYAVEGSTALIRRDFADWEEQAARLQEDGRLLTDDGIDVVCLDEREAREIGASQRFVWGLRNLNDAQFHAGRFVLGLAEGVNRLTNVKLFENSRVVSMEREGDSVRLATGKGVVLAQHVFLATNAWVPQLIPDLDTRLRAERGQVLVTEPMAKRPCRGTFGTTMAWWRDVAEPDGRYRLLFGGGRRRDEPDSLFPQYTDDGQPDPRLEGEGFSPSVAHQNRLELELKKLFPDLVNVPITHRWGGLQSFPADSLPLVGDFSPARRIHGIAGLSGRGNCYSNVGAEFLAGKVAGVVSEVEKRFGDLIEELLEVRRESAVWDPWHSLYDKE